jgi:hypothetical protein
MLDSDDAKRLSLRDDALTNDLKRGVVDPFVGSASLLAKTTTIQTYPTAVQSFFACLPVILLGTESEGSPGVVYPGTSTFFALNIGSSIPPSGTQVVASFVGSRWVFRYDA